MQQEEGPHRKIGLDYVTFVSGAYQRIPGYHHLQHTQMKVVEVPAHLRERSKPWETRKGCLCR